MSEFVDANIFLRLITADDPKKAERCFELIQRAGRGEVDLYTSESIVSEVVYVLSRATYRVPRADVEAALGSALANSGLRMDYKDSVLRALEFWQESKLDFEDCLAIQHARRLALDGIYSYDRDFDRIPDIRRLEP
jgi:predicted nucleic acid-binding protein